MERDRDLLTLESMVGICVGFLPRRMVNERDGKVVVILHWEHRDTYGIFSW